MEPTPIPRFRRRQYLIKTKFQLSYVGLILSLMMITACICSYVVYYTSMVTLGEKLAAVYPQGRLLSIVNMLNIRIILTIIFIMPFIAMIGIFYSHKIAGPIFRIERFLKNMAAGDLTERMALRKGDELISLAEGLENVRVGVISSIDAQRVKLDALSGMIDDIKGALPAKLKNEAELTQKLDNINDSVNSLKTDLARYKTSK